MKITVKKTLIIFHHPGEWFEIQNKLIQDYGKSIVMIRDKCRRELGFTIRHHKGLVPYLEKWGRNLRSDFIQDPMAIKFIEDNKHKKVYEDQIHLDFYNEAGQSWFMLKYLNKQQVDH